VFLYPTNIAECCGANISDWNAVHKYYRNELWRAKGNLEALRKAGLDPIEIIQRRSRELGIRFWMTMRMNEIHEDFFATVQHVHNFPKNCVFPHFVRGKDFLVRVRARRYGRLHPPFIASQSPVFGGILEVCFGDVDLNRTPRLLRRFCRVDQVTAGIFSEKNSWDGIYKVGGFRWGKGAPVDTSFKPSSVCRHGESIRAPVTSTVVFAPDNLGQAGVQPKSG